MFTILLNQDFEDQGHHTEQLGGVYETAAEAVEAAIAFHDTAHGGFEVNPRYDSIDVWQNGAYFGTAYPGDAENPHGYFWVFPLHSHGGGVRTGFELTDEIPF